MSEEFKKRYTIAKKKWEEKNKKELFCPSCDKQQEFELYNKSENGYMAYFRCLVCNHVLTTKGGKL